MWAVSQRIPPPIKRGTWAAGYVGLNVDLGDRDLYRRLRLAAAEDDMTLREIAVEALTYWLDHQEKIEEVLAQRKMGRVMAESTGEYIPHDEVKRRTAR